jgi:hypothetical protein
MQEEEEFAESEPELGRTGMDDEEEEEEGAEEDEMEEIEQQGEGKQLALGDEEKQASDLLSKILARSLSLL